MKKLFLVKILNVLNQRKHIHNNFLSEVPPPTIIIIQNFDHQNYINAKFHPVGSYIQVSTVIGKSFA